VKGHRRMIGKALMAIGLTVLLVLNGLPLMLIMRQALSAPAESVQWPLRWVPTALSLKNV
jgi:hypothetical protein